MNVEELRGAERFTAVQPLSATFSGIPISIVNLSTVGAQIAHPEGVAEFQPPSGSALGDLVTEDRVIWSAPPEREEAKLRRALP